MSSDPWSELFMIAQLDGKSHIDYQPKLLSSNYLIRVLKVGLLVQFIGRHKNDRMSREISC